MMTRSVEGYLSAMQVFGYYASGSETESTLRDNRAVFSRYRLMPRMMVDVSNVDTTLTLLGEMPMPTCSCHKRLAWHAAMSLVNIGCAGPSNPSKIDLRSCSDTSLKALTSLLGWDYWVHTHDDLQAFLGVRAPHQRGA